MTSRAEASFLRVPYDLRPKKQVERRMLIDALQLLAVAGFPVRDYQYTGMGSIYFVDFILLHKFLGLRDMVSVEKAVEHTRRVEFNRPFHLVTVRMGRIGDYLAQISGDRKHLVWLDYDTVVGQELLGDIQLAGTYLTPGSILLVTLDVEPPTDRSAGPMRWKEYFEAEAGTYLDPAWPDAEWAASRLPRTNARVLQRAMESSISSRTEMRFRPLFSFYYADGHQMITCGGMLATAPEQRMLDGSALFDATYARRSFEDLYEIRVPLLTRKERLYLDSLMPTVDDVRNLDFEFDADDLRAYREVYRFLPAYAELLL